jgi:hypothetical protein
MLNSCSTWSSIASGCGPMSTRTATWNASVPWAIDPRTIDEDDVTGAETDRLADDWLPISPGAHTLYVSEDAMGTLDIDVTFRAGYLL